jgi:ferritin-like protein
MTIRTTLPSGPPGPDELCDRLDRLYCYHLMMVQWSIATEGRLTATARRLLQTELDRESRFHLDAANRLAKRVTQLGGKVTADPSDILYRAPVDSFDVPDNPADHRSVLTHLHKLITSASAAYRGLLDRTKDQDPVTQRIVEDLLAAARVRMGDLRAAAEAESTHPAPRARSGFRA